MLQLMRWLPNLPSWKYQGVTLLGPISGDGLEHGTLEDGADYPALAQLILAVRAVIDLRHYTAECDNAYKQLEHDDIAQLHPELPTVRELCAAMEPPKHLFSPNFDKDAPYDYYLILLRNADLHLIYLQDTNSGLDMLGFIAGQASLAGAITGAVGLLKRWFHEDYTIGIPSMIDWGLLSPDQVKEILQSSPYYEESLGDSGDTWEDLLARCPPP